MSYVSTVADFFTTRSGLPAVLSPDDYASIAEWEKQEIPLAFVLQALDYHLGHSQSEYAKPDSIFELRSTVSLEFAESLSGKPTLVAAGAWQ